MFKLTVKPLKPQMHDSWARGTKYHDKIDILILLQNRSILSC